MKDNPGGRGGPGRPSRRANRSRHELQFIKFSQCDIARRPNGPPTKGPFRGSSEDLIDFVRKLSTLVLEMRTSRGSPQRITPVSPGLKALVGSTGRAKLLAHFFLHPGEAFHIRELARLLGESPGSLLRDLRRLEAIRLLQTERVGNQVRYSLDQKHLSTKTYCV